MTKAELVSELAIKTGFDKKTVSILVESLLACIKDNLVKGENVFIRGFGSFVTKQRAAKMARNIREQTTVAVPEHRVPAFKASAELKAAVK